MINGCQNLKPLPAGISFAGKPHPTHHLHFLADQTWVDSAGQRHVEQTIFDRIFENISKARRLILIDMFLYNDFQGAAKETTRALSAELTARLIAHKKRWPATQMIVISDPINTVYGGLRSKHFEQLRRAGIPVVLTRLDALRDSNPLYSFFWRNFVRPFGNNPKATTIANPFGAGSVSVRSYLALLNFKANHRKVMISDRGDEYIGLVTSANPHDGSSAHRNAAVEFSGEAVRDLFATEQAVLALSGASFEYSMPAQPASGSATVQILTEQKIRDALLAVIDAAKPGDALDVFVFYLADRAIVQTLKAAQQRGVRLRILLDPNKDAFGHAKNGIPNRQVAAELKQVGVPIRWCDTHGEQCHEKYILHRSADEPMTLIAGSANFTRRNLGNYNLETDVRVTGPASLPALQTAQAHFDETWYNLHGRRLSVGYDHYADPASWKQWLYRFMEASGFSTF